MKTTLLTAALAALIWAGTAAAAPVGSITTFSNGLSPTSDPFGITPGPDGNVWFADSADGAPVIGRITPSGTITNFALPANDNPLHITTGPDGNLWFAEGVPHPAIVRITTSGVMTRFTTGLPAQTDPIGIASGPDGNLWFTDEGNIPAVGRITPAGAITEFTAGLGASSDPTGMVLGPDGNLWFADRNGAVGRATPSGTVTEFTTGLNAGAQPREVAAGPDGNVWFADSGTTNAVGRITPTGKITEFSAGLNPGSFPHGIALGADGNLWIVDEGTPPAIARISPTGTITEFSNGLPNNAFPDQIAAGPDGNVWFTDSGGGGVSVIGRIGVGAPAPSLRAPSVTGSGEQGTQQQCQGDQWAVWAGQLPLVDEFGFDGYRWLRDGSQVATGPSYTPGAADVGHQLSCSVTVTYPLQDVTASATSAAVNVIARGTGPAGPPGAPGAQGPAGKIELVTCKTPKARGKKRKPRQTCTAKLVNGPVTFKTMALHARLSRAHVTYATGTAQTVRGRLRLLLTPRRQLAAGRYTLTLSGRHGSVRRSLQIR